MADVSNSFSAWKTLPKEELSLCIAIRRSESPPHLYEALIKYYEKIGIAEVIRFREYNDRPGQEWQLVGTQGSNTLKYHLPTFVFYQTNIMRRSPKCAIDPRRVLLMWVHHVEVYFPGYTGYELPPEKAILRHYRDLTRANLTRRLRPITHWFMYTKIGYPAKLMPLLYRQVETTLNQLSAHWGLRRAPQPESSYRNAPPHLPSVRYDLTADDGYNSDFSGTYPSRSDIPAAFGLFWLREHFSQKNRVNKGFSLSLDGKGKERKQLMMFRELEEWKPHLQGAESVGVGIEKKITASVPHFTDTTLGSSSGPEPMSSQTLSRVSSTLSSESLVALFPFDSDIFRPTTMKKENSKIESKKKDEIAMSLRNPNIVALCPLPRIITSVSPKKAPGFFVMSDDATFNFWHTLNLRNVMHPTGITYQDYTGMWWPSPYGKPAVELAVMLIIDKYRNDLSVQKMWKKYQEGLLANGFIRSAHRQLTEVDGWCMSDLYYVPATELHYFSELMIIFFEARLFHEIAISKFLYTVKHYRLDPSEYKYLWEQEREKWAELYSEDLVLLHPIKFSLFVDLDQRSQFCNTVVRTFKKALFDGIGILKTLH
ncbi:hypothetical protein RB195_011395 [Necator americanus]|uniref:Glycosyltransferase family 92 protein n=1 Tax=Necator americanus TaxID=51031 RepID=A0ABR1D4C2_NECAM